MKTMAGIDCDSQELIMNCRNLSELKRTTHKSAIKAAGTYKTYGTYGPHGDHKNS